jgi:hypothetical protein
LPGQNKNLAEISNGNTDNNKSKSFVNRYLPVLIISTFAGADEQENLAKESQNPIANIISLPFENSLGFGVGEEDAFAYAMNMKPVYPLNLGNLKQLLTGACNFRSRCYFRNKATCIGRSYL